MTFRILPWLRGRSSRWVHLQQTPTRHLLVLMAGVFLLLSVIGFYVDLMQSGTEPYPIALANAAFSGTCAITWVITLARLRLYFALILIAAETFLPWTRELDKWIVASFHPAVPTSQAGIRFAATSILVAVMSSYFFLGRYMRRAGVEAVRARNELELAHGIQKTLVPSIHRRTQAFEIYGVSQPSEKVGGDLVDAVDLPGGDVVAYLADIAGHGLQAGILMGMLKTAARTALAGSSAGGGDVLSRLMQTLNEVLPQVKEAHMYATFTALRLNADGTAFCGMAASPPVLHYRAVSGTVVITEEEQFPLGLLPVPGFPAKQWQIEPGDLLLIATDGVLEVTASAKDSDGVEFGPGALARVVAAHAQTALPELSGVILHAVRSYGNQLDDQTLLLVRRLA